jgi:hypothetical protein
VADRYRVTILDLDTDEETVLEAEHVDFTLEETGKRPFKVESTGKKRCSIRLWTGVTDFDDFPEDASVMRWTPDDE